MRKKVNKRKLTIYIVVFFVLTYLGLLIYAYNNNKFVLFLSYRIIEGHSYSSHKITKIENVGSIDGYNILRVYAEKIDEGIIELPWTIGLCYKKQRLQIEPVCITTQNSSCYGIYLIKGYKSYTIENVVENELVDIPKLFSFFPDILEECN